jgi:hypothetical protein
MHRPLWMNLVVPTNANDDHLCLQEVDFQPTSAPLEEEALFHASHQIGQRVLPCTLNSLHFCCDCPGRWRTDFWRFNSAFS